jgi:hypothetical protein
MLDKNPKNLSVDELTNLMVETVNEILALPRNERGRNNAIEKGKYVQLIQKFIKEKQMEFPPDKKS